MSAILQGFLFPHGGCSKFTSTFPLYGHRPKAIVSAPNTNFLYFLSQLLILRRPTLQKSELTLIGQISPCLLWTQKKNSHPCKCSKFHNENDPHHQPTQPSLASLPSPIWLSFFCLAHSLVGPWYWGCSHPHHDMTHDDDDDAAGHYAHSITRLSILIFTVYARLLLNLELYMSRLDSRCVAEVLWYIANCQLPTANKFSLLPSSLDSR